MAPQLTRRIVEHAADPKRDIWTITNRVLYDLCRRHPQHTRVSVIVAKASLIGRTYAAAIERGVRNEPGTRRDTTEFYRLKVAHPLRNARIDRVIEPLGALEQLSPETAPAVLRAHHRLVEVLREAVGQDKRSFSSKYLHFHAPRVVPIYDSYAWSTLKNYVGRVKLPTTWRGPLDESYATFVVRYLHFRDDIANRFGVYLDPRQIDRLLWKVPALDS